MPTKRSKPAVYRGVGLDFDRRPFDAAAVERLIEVTRFPAPPIDTGAISLDDVARVLNAIAIWWKSGRDAADAPTDKMLADAVENLDEALRRACSLAPLHVDSCPWTGDRGDDPRLPPRLAERLRPFVTLDLRGKYAGRLLPGVPDADTLLAALAESLADLCEVVSAATSGGGAMDAENAASEPGVVDLSAPNRTLVQSLAQLYSAVFERDVSWSRTADGGAPSGPLLRFLGEALAVLEARIPPETLI